MGFSAKVHFFIKFLEFPKNICLRNIGWNLAMFELNKQKNKNPTPTEKNPANPAIRKSEGLDEY